MTAKVMMSPADDRELSSHKKKRSENTVFAHDHFRFWETVYNQRLKCDQQNSSPSRPSNQSHQYSQSYVHSPKINRRYANTGFGGEESVNIVRDVSAGQAGITPYRVYVQKDGGAPPTSGGIFEDTVMLRRDSNNQLTVAEPVGYRTANAAQQQSAGKPPRNGRGGVPSYMMHTKSSIKKFSLK